MGHKPRWIVNILLLYLFLKQWTLFSPTKKQFWRFQNNSKINTKIRTSINRTIRMWTLLSLISFFLKIIEFGSHRIINYGYFIWHLFATCWISNENSINPSNNPKIFSKRRSRQSRTFSAKKELWKISESTKWSEPLSTI